MKAKEILSSEEKSREPFPSQKTPTPPQEMDPSKEPGKHNEGQSKKDKKKSK